MRVQLLTYLIAVLLSSFLLTSCVATNGWSSPNNYCFYHADQCSPCALPSNSTCSPCRSHCNMICHNGCCKYCQKPCKSSPGICSTTCCNYSYVFNCCDGRDYWSE